MTIEEEKRWAKNEKEHLAMLIAMRSDKYSLEQLRKKTLAQLQKIERETKP